MTSRVAKISTLAAILVATAAIFAPAASADPPYNTTAGHGQPVRTITPTPVMSHQPRNLPPIDESSALRIQRVSAYHGTTFDWTAAGIGALAAAGACVLVFGVTFDLRRRRQPSVA